MPLSDEFLNELRMKADIEATVSPYVTLKRKGRLLGGLCPFHNEKTPSFYVYPETQSYYCFGCGSGGDVITFIKNIENLDYMEAVKFLCDKNGIAMPEDNYDRGLMNIKRRIYEANREAARFYYKQLVSGQNAKGREYCSQRRLSPDTVKNFGLGYAPEGWDILKKHLNSLGFTDNELLQADLIKQTSKGNCIDSFRNRLVFPIIDLRGNVLGFSGRRINEEDNPKYVNTKDTAVYKKGREIFGLNLAKKGNTDRLILCEGNVDVVMLHQAGFTNAVACLGTALTQEQAQILSRYTGEILICYDNDEAGRKAVEKALNVFSQTSLHTKVITMSGGKDPDEIIRNHGVERFRALIEGASNDVEYKLNNELHKYDVLTNDGKVSYMKAASNVLASLNNAVEVDVYASKLSEELNISKQAILSEVQKAKRSYKRTEQRESFDKIKKSFDNPRDVRNRINPQRRDNLHAAKAEETLISILMNMPSVYNSIKEKISADDFVTEFNSRVFGVICQRINEDKPVDLTFLGSYFNDEEMGVIAGITANAQLIGNNINECEDCIRVIKNEKGKSNEKPSDMSEDDFLNIFRQKNKKENT
ncbi:MAG: DNA primase [Clostridia bacterium]|nr:DNA primase [Clostridia bacterium]